MKLCLSHGRSLNRVCSCVSFSLAHLALVGSLVRLLRVQDGERPVEAAPAEDVLGAPREALHFGRDGNLVDFRDDFPYDLTTDCLQIS